MKYFPFYSRLFEKKNTKVPGGKTFESALNNVNVKLEKKLNFSLVRFGDGEMAIINGKLIDFSDKHNGEHRYIPGDEKSESQRALLVQALEYNDEHYIVGIACPCCVGKSRFFDLKKQSGQNEEHLTWANIFVNANYPKFESRTVAILQSRKTVLICHQRAQPDGLPLTIEKNFFVGSNSWIADYDRLLLELCDYIESNGVQDQVFLFCAGVLSNILIYELHRRYPGNTYLDLGSVFDVELGLGKTRKYLKKGKTLRKVCVWG